VFRISHIHREGNFCADWVTKWIRELGSDIVLADGFPFQLASLAQADADGIGICYPRN